MKVSPIYISLITALLGLIAAETASAQYKVQGNVYDSSKNYPLASVSVLSTGGKGTVTDINGHYVITVGEKDSIWFSYLGKPTIKFPVLKMADVAQFDIALKIPVNVLKEVTVRPRSYRQDSLQNRKDYEKIYNFHRPNLGSMTSIGPSGAGIDIDEIIRLFQFRKNRNTEKFQERLLQQEQDKFIEHRFTKALVRRLTALEGDELTRFMEIAKPAYEFTLYASDYTFQAYIKEAFEEYKRQKSF